MKRVQKIISLFLFLLLCIDAVAPPLAVLSEDYTNSSRIRRTYLNDKKDDGQLLKVNIDDKGTSKETLDLCVELGERLIVSNGLVIIMQKGLAIDRDDNGRLILPVGWVEDTLYDENEVKELRSSSSQQPKTKAIISSNGTSSASPELYSSTAEEAQDEKVGDISDSLTEEIDQLSVYGEEYYSIRIKPAEGRTVEWEQDPSQSNRSFEKLKLSFKKVGEVQSGELVAIHQADYMAILSGDDRIFKEKGVAEETEVPQSEKQEQVSGNSPPSQTNDSSTQASLEGESQSASPSNTDTKTKTSTSIEGNVSGQLMIQLREKGISNSEVGIEGSKFEITNIDQPELSQTGVTDRSGNLVFKNLILGNYQLLQVTTKEGYEADRKTRSVKVTAEKNPQTIDIFNTKKNFLDRLVEKVTRPKRNARSVEESRSLQGEVKEGTVVQDIVDTLTMEIPGISMPYRQGGNLRKKEVKIVADGQRTIVWEYTATIEGINPANIKQIALSFMAPTDSGLGEPKVTSVTRDGVSISDGRTTNYGENTDFKSSTTTLPIQDGRYVLTIDTPIRIPSHQYTLDYNTDIKVKVPERTRLTQDGVTTVLRAGEEQHLTNSGSLTLDSDYQTSPFDTPKVLDAYRINGQYRESDTRVIEWTSSRLNATNSPQTYTFDATLDSQSQSVHSREYFIYAPDENGVYQQSQHQTLSSTINQIQVQNVPPGGIALTKTVTNVTNEKRNHTITGAELEALKADMTIKKNWADGAPPVDVTFTITSGSQPKEIKLTKGQSTLTVPNMDKFAGGISTATSKRIYYQVDEKESDGYRLSTVQSDWKGLHYVFTNEKIENQEPVSPSGECGNYGVTGIEPVVINYFMQQSGKTVWGGFGGSLKMRLKFPPFAHVGDSFTIELPPELKLAHPANPDTIWATVTANGKKVANVIHEKDNLIRFILTDQAYSVQEYDGWFEIGNDVNIIKLNNQSGNRIYKTGVLPELPEWYNLMDVSSTVIKRTLNFKSVYQGNMTCDKVVKTEGTLNATNTDTSQGGLQTFKGLNKYLYEQTKDTFTWEIVYNAGRRSVTGGLPFRRKFYDHLHPSLSLYPYGNESRSIPEAIEIYVADGTAAMSYAKDGLVKLQYRNSTNNGQIHHYYLPGSDIGVSAQIYPETHSYPEFDNIHTTHAVEFYQEGWDMRNKAIIVRLKENKIRAVNGSYYNVGHLKYESWVNGGGQDPTIFRREPGTRARGGAYPVDWYSLQFKKVAEDNGQRRALGGAIYTLYKNGEPHRTAISSPDTGIFQFSDLTGGTYTFKETQAPPGYQVDPKTYTLVIKNADVMTIDGVNYDKQKLREFVNRKKETVGLTIKKRDAKGNPLAGASFKLSRVGETDGKAITLGTDVSSDEFLFKGLTVGDYTLEEVKAPSGYLGMSTLTLEVYKDGDKLNIRKKDDPNNTKASAPSLANGVVTLNIVNQPFAITFTKRVSGSNNPLANAVFELRKLEENGTSTTVQRNIVSQSNGQFSFDKIVANGRYEVWEVKTPTGYQKPTTAVARFTVDESGNPRFEHGNTTITNTKMTFKIKVVKVDGLTGQTITDGVNDTAPRFVITNERGEVINGQQANLISGVFTFDNKSAGFDPGTYYLKEARAPAGYIPIEGLIPFTIHSDGRISVDESKVEGVATSRDAPDTIELRAKNYRKGNLRISKRIKGLESLSNLISSEMTFTLTKDGTNPAQTITKTQSANQDFVFEDLMPGTYILTEARPPSGYVRQPLSYRVMVEPTGTTLYRLTADPASPVTNATIIKSDSLSRILSGAETAITDGQDGTSVTYHQFDGHKNDIPVGAYIGLDLQTVKNVRSVRFAQGGNNPLDRFANYRLQYSIDGRTYIDLGNFDQANLIQQTDILARYIRVINQSEVTNKWFVVKDLSVTAHDTQEVSSTQETAGKTYRIGNIQNPMIKIEKYNLHNTLIPQPLTFKLYKVMNDATAQTVTGMLNDTSLVQTIELTSGQSASIPLLAKDLGRYALVEVAPPQGYQALSGPILMDLVESQQAHNDSLNKAVTRFNIVNQSDMVEVDSSNAVHDNTLKIKVKNAPNRYTIKVRKRDYDQPDQGLDARFQLYREDGTTAIPGKVGNTTVGDNFVTFTDLELGTYFIKEVRAPSDAYQPVDQLKPIKLRIEESGRLTLLEHDANMVSLDNPEGTTLGLTVKNIKRFTFRVKKVDTGIPEKLLDGAGFTIYREVNGQKGQELARGNTKNGLFETKLDVGYYLLQETTAPAGYTPNKTLYRFQINHDGSVKLHNGDEMVSLAQADSSRAIVFTMKNKRATINLKLAKRAYSDPNTRLVAQFELKEEGSVTAPVRTVTTKADGEEVRFDQLAAGKTYLLRETKAPDGYQLNKQTYRIRVDNQGLVHIENPDQLIVGDSGDRELIIVKNLKKGEYPKTGGTGFLPYLFLGGGLMLLAILCDRRRRQHSN